MSAHIPDVPPYITGGAIGAAYHLFDELALSVPPSARLDEIRQAIARLRSFPQQASEDETQKTDGVTGTAGNPNNLDKLASDLFASQPTNWCDVVARAELVDLYATCYGHEAPKQYRRAVAELVSAILRLSKRTEPEQVQEFVDGGDGGSGCVYLVRSGPHFKIGRTNCIERRIPALATQLPEKIVLIHHIKTEDPAGIETYWHRRFADQRKNGEWFALSTEHVEMFKARTVM